MTTYSIIGKKPSDKKKLLMDLVFLRIGKRTKKQSEHDWNINSTINTRNSFSLKNKNDGNEIRFATKSEQIDDHSSAHNVRGACL